MSNSITTKSKFAPMPGSRITAGQAQAAGLVFTDIIQKHGVVKAELVLDAGRPESSPIHGYFTWDDGIAAEKHRITEAQTLIRSVRVIRDDMPAQEQPAVRYLLSVEATESETRFEGKAYLPLPDIKNNPEYRRQVLQDALSEFRSLQKKYRDLESELGQIFNAVTKVTEELEQAA
jgi:Mor family transcriptional regulator